MFRRPAAALAVTAVLLGLSALPAAAQYDEPTIVSVSAATIAAGDTVEIAGSGFAAGSEVSATAELDDEVVESATADADSAGDVAFRFRLDQTGEHLITLSGLDVDGQPVSTTTTVVAEGVAGRPPVAEDAADRDARDDGARAEDHGSGDDGAAAGTSDDELAYTGGSLLPLWGGLAFVVVGAAALVTARVRKRET